jgi:tRNA threonylcarbamoyladenosine biosynthesis protein TsaB
MVETTLKKKKKRTAKASHLLPNRVVTYIINIETSSKNCSVAIAKNGVQMCCIEAHDDHFIHAEKLHMFVDEALKSANITLADVQAIAISAGPGSYTGLRIGTSAAKGFCYALQIPLIALSSTEILVARMATPTEATIIAAIDARRDEIYTQVFSGAKEPLSPIYAHVLTENSFGELNLKQLLFVGDGAEKSASAIKWTDAAFDQCLPSAADMCQLSYTKYKEGQFADVAYFEPFYLKDFVAGKPKKIL